MPARYVITLILALALAAAGPLSAQTATLVKDINPLEDTGLGSSSSPRWLHAVGDKVFFTAFEASSGRELWVTDGTGLGTELLADACPGECSSQPFPLGHAGGVLFWTDGSNSDRIQLWRSDGTRAGTFSLTPEESGVSLGDSTDELVYALTDRLLYFVGCTAETGCELWASDGTRAGTRLVKDFTPGIGGSYLGLLADGGKVFVTRRDFYYSQQAVWTTDGTAAGTVLLRDFGAGHLDSATTAGGHLFFTFTSQAEGAELWASDGTRTGTLQLTRFSAPAPFTVPTDGPALKASGRRVYFVADDSVHGPELWRSDGTAAGTERLTDFAFATPFRAAVELSFVEEVGDKAVFIATDGVTVPKLWTSQGSPASVTALPVPCGGACEFLSQEASLLKVGSRVFFTAGDGAHGKELWSTDGTAAGTRMLRDVCPGTCDGILFFSDFTPVAETLLFLATEPVHGIQLWSSDGTPAGTRRLTDFQLPGAYVRLHPEEGGAARSGSRIFFSAVDPHQDELWVSENGQAPRLVADIARAGASSFPASLVPWQGGLAFTAEDGITFRREVWRSDGASGGTLPVTTGPPFSSFAPSGLTTAGATLFFLTDADVSSGQALWRTDGTAAGTVTLVTDRYLSPPVALAGSVYLFSSELAGDHTELWRSDGTPGGTGPVVSLPSQATARDLKALGGKLYFHLAFFSGPQQFWRSDGTAAGTVKLADFQYGADEDPPLVPLGSRVFFLNRGSLWSTDGTPAGTSLKVSFETTRATELAALGGSLYFIAESAGVRELWRSDGSAAGTVRLASFPGAQTSTVSRAQLTVAAGRLFFAADDGAHGAEVWTSDGTAAGTALVRDVFPGLDGSRPSGLYAAGGRLFFTAVDGTHGFELWQTDGTPAGTRMVQDIAPEEASSTPDQLTLIGDRLFFTADDGIAGRELWSLPLAAPAGCQPSPAQLCLGGRYRVEAVWRDFEGHTGRGTGVALTADTGYFWFFSPANVEAVVKVLDGQGVNGHTWVFYGALSNVRYDLTVTDTQTGLTRRYSNLEGRFASVGDTHGFGPLGAYGAQPVIAPASPPPLIRDRVERAAAVPCQPSARRLCLNNGRFAVEVDWKDFQNRTGQGTAVPLSGDTGTFWFFDSANVELVVKALDGRPVNGHFWLFYGALSNVEYKLTVTDTQTGKVRTYNNPSGRFASAGDTLAF